MKKTISVIIPVYNEEKYIIRCITSLVNQARRPDEIIVVDDGSTDGSVAVIRNFQFSIFNFQLINQRHSGPAKARNLGANYAKGDILIFADADMYFDKKYLERLVKPIIEKKAFATFTKEEYVANPENVWSQCWNINSGLPKKLHIDPNIPNRTTTFRAISKKVFLKLGGYKSRGYTDDVTVLDGSQTWAVPAKGAICYHFNPSSLAEVFSSARWIGKSFERNIVNFIIYFPFNSLIKGIIESIKHKKIQFLPFKVIFDFGITTGLIERMLTGKHYK